METEKFNQYDKNMIEVALYLRAQVLYQSALPEDNRKARAYYALSKKVKFCSSIIEFVNV